MADGAPAPRAAGRAAAFGPGRGADHVRRPERLDAIAEVEVSEEESTLAPGLPDRLRRILKRAPRLPRGIGGLILTDPPPSFPKMFRDVFAALATRVDGDLALARRVLLAGNGAPLEDVGRTLGGARVAGDGSLIQP